MEDQRRLGLEYRQIVRKYHTSLRKSNKSASRVDISRVQKECAQSFWKFVSKVLDGDETSSNSKPSFDSSSAQAFFTRIYSSHSSHLTLNLGSQPLLILTLPLTMMTFSWRSYNMPSGNPNTPRVPAHLTRSLIPSLKDVLCWYLLYLTSTITAGVHTMSH